MPWFFASHLFLFVLLMILSSFLAGFYLFYQYIYLTQNYKPEAVSSQAIFSEKNYQAILEYWQKREKAFNEGVGGQIKNPFK